MKQLEKTVFCAVYKENLPALNNPPVPTKLGELAVEKISQKAWGRWMEISVILVNEHRLNLMNKIDRDFLTDNLRDFIDGKDVQLPDTFKEVK